MAYGCSFTFLPYLTDVASLNCFATESGPILLILVSKFLCMANNGAKDPLLSGSLDATQKTKQQLLNKRRLLRSRSAPHAELVPTETNCNESIPRTASIFQNLHPSFKRMAIYLAVYLGVGALIFYLVRNQIKGQKTDGILDALYFTIVTMTTVGYGDLVPNSHLAKLLACAFVFSGMALIGLIVSKAADYLVEKQELLLVKAMRMHQKIGSTEILREVETNKTRYKLFLVFFLLLILIIAGTIFLVTVEKLDVIDAFYCVCSTITTLGYGDQSFSTQAGRIFAVFWILTGTITLAQLFVYIAELNTEIRQKELVKWVLTRKVTNLDLEAADLDEDGTVGFVEHSFKVIYIVILPMINMALFIFISFLLFLIGLRNSLFISSKRWGRLVKKIYHL